MRSQRLASGFASDRNTPTGIDPVTLAITYNNMDGTTERQTETLGIPFKGKADIAISSVTTDPVRRSRATRSRSSSGWRIPVPTVPPRSGLPSTAPLPGQKTAFIGSIDKDSDAPAIFYLQATKDGTVPVNHDDQL